MARKGRGRKSARGLPWGVTLCAGRFKAQVTVDYVNHSAGSFATAQEAHAAALLAHSVLTGEAHG